MRYLFLILLAGCGGGRDFGTHYDAIDKDTGLRVRYDKRTNNNVNTVIQWYKETMDCVDINASGPLVIFVEDLEDMPNNRNGWIYYPDTIVIWSLDGSLHAGGIKGFMVRHEFVHYLLNTVDFHIMDNNNHKSHLFMCEIYQG